MDKTLDVVDSFGVNDTLVWGQDFSLPPGFCPACPGEKTVRAG